MHDALSVPRLHNPKNHVVGYYSPELSSNRPILIENARGPMFRTMGQADSSNQTWLLPEEALYLLERGSLDIRWRASDVGNGESGEDIPMSLQAAYATLLGKNGLTLERYHVYAGLRRIGYILSRAPTWEDDAVIPGPQIPTPSSPKLKPSGGLLAVFRRVLSSIFDSKKKGFPAVGPLLAPGLWRSYPDIYNSLSLIKSHKPEDSNSNHVEPRQPFRVSYHVWKPSSAFKKSNPPLPDFRIAVVDARSTQVPTLEQIGSLLDSQPEDRPASDKRLEVKLRWGYRNVILAIIDTGVVSYLRVSDAAFGQEKVYINRNKVGAKGGYRKGSGKSGGKRG